MEEQNVAISIAKSKISLLRQEKEKREKINYEYAHRIHDDD